ncbi:hypothetical protein Ddc_14092 [Ditylenchus destructor]|nr:hypothetical protein Ddc_14092 [Ditylenchus destructor]
MSDSEDDFPLNRQVPNRNPMTPQDVMFEMAAVRHFSAMICGPFNNEAWTRKVEPTITRKLRIVDCKWNHPTLYSLIDGLKKAQAAVDIEYEEFVRGDAPPQKRIKFQQADARILQDYMPYCKTTIIAR